MKNITILLTIPVIVIILGIWYTFSKDQNTLDIKTFEQEIRYKKQETKNIQTTNYNNENGPKEKIVENINLSQVESRDDPLKITGNKEVDNYIRGIAEGRGYELREIADESTLVSIQGQKLHKDIVQDFLAIQGEMKKLEMNLVLASGYRSVERQREIFLKKLGDTFSNQGILEGKADELLHSILAQSSIPGYSKHHSGKAIDFGCNNYILENSVFEPSECYKWLSANDFENAKTYNFEPSYPPSPISSGPEPESWEFVYKLQDA